MIFEELREILNKQFWVRKILKLSQPAALLYWLPFSHFFTFPRLPQVQISRSKLAANLDEFLLLITAEIGS